MSDDVDGDGEVRPPSKPAVRIAVSDKFLGAMIALLVGGGAGVGGHFIGSQNLPSGRDHQALEERVRSIEDREHAREVAAAKRDQSIDDRLGRIEDKLADMNGKLDGLSRKNR